MGALRDIATMGKAKDSGAIGDAISIADKLGKKRQEPASEDPLGEAYRDTYDMSSGRRKRQAAKRY
ncbi:MAG TPA: hypothetical protein VEL77_15155 [Rugosimonospora sp.]|nr:hypothetical protein [Rugosimonospora sp.]